MGSSKPRASIKPRRGGYSVRVGDSFTFCETLEHAREVARWMQAQARGEPYRGPVERVPLSEAAASWRDRSNFSKLH